MNSYTTYYNNISHNHPAAIFSALHTLAFIILYNIMCGARVYLKCSSTCNIYLTRLANRVNRFKFNGNNERSEVLCIIHSFETSCTYVYYNSGVSVSIEYTQWRAYKGFIFRPRFSPLDDILALFVGLFAAILLQENRMQPARFRPRRFAI